MQHQTAEPAGQYNLVVNQSRYTYTIRPHEVTNSLGFVRAVLQEYLVTGQDGQQYKLYRTTEGNWYDVEQANPTADAGLLLHLKMELDAAEKRKP